MPTQVTGVYADIYAWENLLTAYLRAAHGKRSQEAVARFERRLEDNLVALQDDLRQGTYQPGPYTNFTIHESKRRVISATSSSRSGTLTGAHRCGARLYSNQSGC